MTDIIPIIKQVIGSQVPIEKIVRICSVVSKYDTTYSKYGQQRHIQANAHNRKSTKTLTKSTDGKQVHASVNKEVVWVTLGRP
jgi:carbohydrate-selective porin OprB